MDFDAVILAGGRSSRLGGFPKSTLLFAGSTLLARTVEAAADARRTVIVADPQLVAEALPAALLTDAVLVTQESPAFGGPAAGLAAGLAALTEPDGQVLVLSCDMPYVDEVVPRLIAAAGSQENSSQGSEETSSDGSGGTSSDGVVAVDESGRLQYLTGVYRVSALRAAVEAYGADVAGASMRDLLSPLNLATVEIDSVVSGDVDTWDDAERFGISREAAEREASRRKQEKALSTWVARLATELGMPDLAFSLDDVLALAGDAAHGVMRPAAPLTTFLVGYRAGLTAAFLNAAPADAAPADAAPAEAAPADAAPADLAWASEVARRLAAGWNTSS